MSNADLRGAVDVWQFGLNEYSSDCCRIALQEVTSVDGNFEASVFLADGSEQVIVLAPEGLGLKSEDLQTVTREGLGDQQWQEALRRAIKEATNERNDN